MDWHDIEARIRAGEDERTEFKEWDGFPEKVAVALCAMANSEGGLVVLGVDDVGHVVGVSEDPDAAQEALTNLLQTGLNAPVRARLGRQHDGDKYVHWIEVRKYRGPEPLRRKGRTYVRRGRSSVEPSPAEMQELYNIFGFVLTEEQVIPGSGLRDIDLETFRIFLLRQGLDLAAEPQPEIEADLLGRGALARDDSELRATLFGVLGFGFQPQSFNPTRNAWTELVAYAGKDRASETLQRGEAKGRLVDQVERALGWFKGLGTKEVYAGSQRTDIHLLPLAALREALVNAVAHRDYAILGSKIFLEVFSDRVELLSPGELPNHTTADGVMRGGLPRSRNEAIAHYLQVMGLMEKRGRGFPIMRKEMMAFNGTLPELENNRDGRFVRVTFRFGTLPPGIRS